jgi:hypothetical protein
MRTKLTVLFAFLFLAHCKKNDGTPPREPAPSPASIQVRVGRAGDAQALPFDIGTVYEQRQPTKVAPFHRPGGEWTYFDAKLKDGTEFTVGLVETGRFDVGDGLSMTMVEAMLHVPTNDAGARLSHAFAQTFGAKVPSPRAKRGPPQPLIINSVNLGENVRRTAGGFGGKGTWTASKWTLERNHHAAEVYFNFSLAEKKGEWSQKDSMYDDDVAQDLMEVLHDGAAF